jgi:hypothetical protein
MQCMVLHFTLAAGTRDRIYRPSPCSVQSSPRRAGGLIWPVYGIRVLTLEPSTQYTAAVISVAGAFGTVPRFTLMRSSGAADEQLLFQRAKRPTHSI